MPANPPVGRLVSVGYEGRSQEELVAALSQAGVSVLVDVRLTPLSRKRGLSKTALAQALHAVGIGYVHHRELGNPKDNRDGYRRADPGSLARYEAVLAGADATGALQHIAELLEEGTVALLCFESDPATCHRHQVLERLVSLRPALRLTQV
ncbi:MAG: DUF488 domain-containing protein [Propionibacteriaceae bacterium]|jgi:uncharacterized protein (DUF488 family)|nr:DUF488 domain-containing protein [Propionibacteriaceae bacterium]